MSGRVIFFLIVAAVDCTGEYKVIGSHQPIKVLVGQDVILPCHLEPTVDVTTLTVEWRLGATLVHVYRNRKDDRTVQHKDFGGRVNKADAGNYTCFVPKLDSEFRRGYISLIVEDKDNKPKPMVDSSQNIGVHVGTDVSVILGIIGIIVAI